MGRRVRRGRRTLSIAFATVVCLSLILMLLEQITIDYSVYQRQLCAVETAREKYQSGSVDLSNELVNSMIRLLEERSVFLDKFWELGYKETREVLRYPLTGVNYLDKEGAIRLRENEIPSWANFAVNINDRYLYDWSDDNVNDLLTDMATLPLQNVEQNTEGSELKFNFIFHERFWANAKAMRFSREAQTNPNHFVMDEFERHIAEIAAFHLDRLLGFCRVPPTTGRRVDLVGFSQLVPNNIRRTFFESPAGNTCFYGDCEEHCNPKYAFCGQGDTIEFSLMVYVPTKLNGQSTLHTMANPYKPSISRFNKAVWEVDADYCDIVKQTRPYNQRETLLNLIDIHIFDFLTGNRDRYSIAFFVQFGPAAVPILYDNGRGFGTSDRDYLSILTPLRQCCQIRKSTLLKLVKLYKGPEKLSALMNDSLKADPVTPVLIPPHLHALDRRLVEVLKAVAECLITKKRSLNKVVFEDV